MLLGAFAFAIGLGGTVANEKTAHKFGTVVLLGRT